MNMCHLLLDQNVENNAQWQYKLWHLTSNQLNYIVWAITGNAMDNPKIVIATDSRGIGLDSFIAEHKSFPSEYDINIIVKPEMPYLRDISNLPDSPKKMN